MGHTDKFGGYRAYLAGSMDSVFENEPWKKGFDYISFYNWALILRKTNQRAAHCIHCGKQIEIGTGIYQKLYQNNGYLHLDCAKTEIIKHGGRGFIENVLLNLQVCLHTSGRFTAQEVASSIRSVDEVRAKALKETAEMPASALAGD